MQDPTPKKTAWPPGWLISFALGKPILVVGVVLALTAAFLWYSVTHFRIDTNLSEMISDEVPFRKNNNKLKALFPVQADSFVLVIDGPTAETTAIARDQLYEQLKETGSFQTVFSPGSLEFFKTNGLLYRSEDSLWDLSENLAKAQPFLGAVAEDPSLSGLFGLLSDIVTYEKDAPAEADKLDTMWEGLAEALEAAGKGNIAWMPWQRIMTSAKAARDSEDKNFKGEQTRQFIMLMPQLDFTHINPVRDAERSIRKVLDSPELAALEGVRVRRTGNLALRTDNLKSVGQGVGTAAVVSISLVAVILYFGLGSWQLLSASLAALFIGLIWTLGLALLILGRLNMISVTFIVLFIGLGIDYSIQFCLRMMECIGKGASKPEALVTAFKDVGAALTLCSATTALGFFAFIPTSYVGASELGFISGMGILVCLFINLTFLPGMLVMWRRTPRMDVRCLPPQLTFLPQLPFKHTKAVLWTALIAAVGGGALLPQTYFDSNPWNLENQKSQSVTTAKELFKEPQQSPWVISVLAEDVEAADELAATLDDLSVVASTTTLSDLVPVEQEAKALIIEEMSYFLPDASALEAAPADPDAFVAAADALLADMAAEGRTLSASEKRFAEALEAFTDIVQQGELGVLERAETALLKPMEKLLEQLSELMQAEPFGVDDLPEAMKSRYMNNGHYRIEARPAENVNELDALKRFVDEVTAVVPEAAGPPVSVVMAGRAISDSFKSALSYAVAAVVIVLIVTYRNFRDVLFTILPLFLALLLTAAASVLLDIPFNFANIIVLPLLLGIGVDYCVHLSHRHNSLERKDTLLTSSTAKGVILSAVTTTVSFSSLWFSAHRGTAGMGIMLGISTTLIIVSSLFILPALYAAFGKKKQ